MSKKHARRKPKELVPKAVKPAKKRPTEKRPSSRKTASSKRPSRRKSVASTSASLGDGQKLGFPVVGIGASAGGLEAMAELLANMPVDTGMAFVVVTHQHPGHISMLPELLGKETEMPVVSAEDGLRVEPNSVYVGPPGGHLAILNGTLYRMETEKQKAPRLPIDHFFRKLAEDQRQRAICIILSGTGTDGTLGLKAIKGESGMAMVEQPESAKYSGMPSSAIATGLADYVLSPVAMPKQLVAYANGPYLKLAAGTATAPVEPKLFDLLRNRTGHDFSGYKSNTLRRRIERRMNIHQITNHNEYLQYLEEKPDEIDILFKELLISVTNFFRDAKAWDALGPWLKELVESHPKTCPFRVWVPGCATGEEAYSIAIVLRECMETLRQHFDVQVFGTDLDREAIDVARSGQYPAGIAGDLAPHRLERFFVRNHGTYRIRKEIRELAIFAPQNVIKDPPFTKLDIISCRNLLIYLNSDLQKKLLPIFHYALRPDGLLFLGPSETIGSLGDLFVPLDKRWKIFRRQASGTAHHALPEIPAQSTIDDRRGRVLTTAPQSTQDAQIATQVERLLLSRFAPPSVAVNERGDIIYIHGRTGMYLEPAPGRPRTNILEMAREGLQIELAWALRQCASRGTEVVREGVRVKTNGDFAFTNISVTKLDDLSGKRGLLLVTFPPFASLTAKAAKSARKKRIKLASGDRVAQLEQELQYMRETHQRTLEELETSNEELKSTNEELQSTNEELQSTNEELETSKEEMQSLNEELTTVNAELQSSVDDLSQANDDMQNLLNSTDIATVFLDNELNIKRYTDQARELIMLRKSDVGRPISELASSLDRSDLAADCRRVLKTLVYKESEVHTSGGSWYLMRIIPYRTADNLIDGLVLTFVDINSLKESEAKLRRVSRVFQAASDPIFIEDLDGRLIDLNDEAVRVYGWSREELIGQPIKVLVPSTRQKQVDELLARCKLEESIRNVEALWVTKDNCTHPVLLTLTLLTDEQDQPIGIATLTKDLTEQKETEAQLRRMSRVFQHAAEPIIIVNLEGKVVDLNNEAVQEYGYSPEEMIGTTIKRLVPRRHQKEMGNLLARCVQGEMIRNVDGARLNKQGDQSLVLLTLSLLADDEGRPDAVAISTTQVKE